MDSEIVRHVRSSSAVSLDVFDTVLTRACGPPHALYLWLGFRLYRRGIISCTPENFARARIRAERIVWDRAGGMDSDVSLEDFHREAVRMLWLESDLIPRLVDEELRLEEEVLRPVTSGERFAELACAEGRRIWFTSDTYFSRSFLERQLKRHGIWTPQSVCLASSERSKSKASGRLFDDLVQEARLPARSLIHIGDNPYSDVAMPRTRRLRSAWLPDARLNRYEDLLADQMWETSGMSAALAGASRLARLNTPAANGRECAIRDVAVGVAAPALVGYVLWVLLRAADLGLSRVYFLARDGQILFEIAKKLVEKLRLCIDVRYLWVSRRAVNAAATFKVDDEELSWVIRDIPYLCPEEFFARLDVPWSEVAADMADLEIDPRRSPISLREGRILVDYLQSRKGSEVVLNHVGPRRELATGYLRQEGLLEGPAVGLVDFGGVGSQMRALHALVSQAGAAAPRLFLMGLDRLEDPVLGRPKDESAWLSHTECYLYDHRRGRAKKRARGFGTVVQMFCAADHGTVTGYQCNGGGIAPVLACERDSSVMSWGLPLFRASIECFLDHLVLDPELLDLRADLREVSCSAIEMFWSAPTVDEAVAWGAFPFEGAQAADSAPTPLATRYSWPSVVRGMIDRSFPDLGWCHWFEGSLRQSSPLLRGVLVSLERTYRSLEKARGPFARNVAKRIRSLLRT
jgi:FMN phosphatase YigB (HAD superfamily)